MKALKLGNSVFFLPIASRSSKRRNSSDYWNVYPSGPSGRRSTIILSDGGLSRRTYHLTSYHLTRSAASETDYPIGYKEAKTSSLERSTTDLIIFAYSV
jgi:hypothetical protein